MTPPKTSIPNLNQTVPGLGAEASSELVETLQGRLAAMLDLQLVLKHVHWNVVGPNFISVHEMLDEHVAAVRSMSDELAERIRTLGGTPNGNSGAIVEQRSWSDYPLGRADTNAHLAELDSVYTGMVEDHRSAVERSAKLDPITEDMLIGQTGRLEMFQWFVRSFIERS